MKDTPRHAGRLFLWQRRRRSTEDAIREENKDLTGEESQPGHELKLNQREKGKTPQVTLADLARWQRRRKLNQRENGTLQQTYQEGRPGRQHYREHRGPGHIQNTVVLDI